MKTKSFGSLIFLPLSVIALNVLATPITLTSGLNLDRNANILVNGSFKNHPTNGTTEYVWATGTTLSSFVPFAVPGGWTSAGGARNYATWGGTSSIRGSASIPDGVAALYFGNSIVSSISSTPIFNLDGTITFSSPPTITPLNASFTPAVTLSQTVSVTPGNRYGLSFWASGEDARSGGSHDGIFGLDVNGATVFLATPSGSATGLGASHIYEFEFIPTISTLTLTFTNWGHLNSSTPGWTLPGTTELVLDDVILNAIPEPSSISLLLISFCALVFLRLKAESCGRIRGGESKMQLKSIGSDSIDL